MAYKQNGESCGRPVYQPYDVTSADDQNIASTHKGFSTSCGLLDEFQEVVTPTNNACQAGSSSYTNHRQNNPVLTDSNSFTSLADLTDNHGGSYNTLNNVHMLTADTLFVRPPLSYTPCKLPTTSDGLSHDSVGTSDPFTNLNQIWSDRYTEDQPNKSKQFDQVLEDELHAYKMRTLPVSQSSVYEDSEQQFCDNVDPHRLFYDNVQCYAPAYFNGVANVYSKTNRLAHFDGSVSGHFTERENDRSHCLLQNEATWRGDNTSQYQGCFVTSPEAGSNGTDRVELECRNYHHDVPHTHNSSSNYLMTPSDEHVTQTFTANEHSLHLNSTAHHFLLEDATLINSSFHPSEHSETDRRQEAANLNEGLADVRKDNSRHHLDQGTFDGGHTDCPSNEPILRVQACDENKTSRRGNLKVRSKKTDCVESLQHQLELLEENRRKGGSNSFRYQMGGSDQQKTEVDNVASIIDVDHMISSGVTVAGFKPRAIIRKRNKTHTPGEVKNMDYWQKRRKNNDSARKSRESKKEKEKNFYKRALELEYENIYLHECLRLAEAELTSLGHQFVPPAFDHQNFYY
ncbi:hypothetical protein Btru_014576 [Bulinus truncatus]|nr:hypothetical protein Btru_014576 [Bulinus truncatus]